MRTNTLSRTPHRVGFCGHPCACRAASTLRHERLKSAGAGLILALISWVCLNAGLQLKAQSFAPSTVSPPAVMREMRGVWVASVGNIDWPSTNGLNGNQQKSELIELLNKAV